MQISISVDLIADALLLAGLEGLWIYALIELRTQLGKLRS